MTTWTIAYKLRPVYGSLAETFASTYRHLVSHLITHTRTIISGGAILAGLSIPFMMSLEWLPATLFLGVVGLAFTAAGCVLALFYSGEL